MTAYFSKTEVKSLDVRVSVRLSKCCKALASIDK